MTKSPSRPLTTGKEPEDFGHEVGSIPDGGLLHLQYESLFFRDRDFNEVYYLSFNRAESFAFQFIAGK